jgi:hypothetical protein
MHDSRIFELKFSLAVQIDTVRIKKKISNGIFSKTLQMFFPNVGMLFIPGLTGRPLENMANA